MLSPRLYYLGILELICLFQVGCSRNASRPCLAIKDEPSCVCFHPDGEGIINGTLLALKPPYAPKWVFSQPQTFIHFLLNEKRTNFFLRFKGLLDQYKYEYSLNPCYPYSQGLCANVHVSDSTEQHLLKCLPCTILSVSLVKHHSSIKMWPTI